MDIIITMEQSQDILFQFEDIPVEFVPYTWAYKTVNLWNQTIIALTWLFWNIYTKTEIWLILSAYYNKTDIDTLLSWYYTKSQIDAFWFATTIWVSANFYTKSQLEAKPFRWITSTKISNRDIAYMASHSHSNKPLLDSLISNWLWTKYLSDDGTYKTVASWWWHIIQNQWTSLTQRSKLNFVWPWVTASDDLANNATVVTILWTWGGTHWTGSPDTVVTPDFLAQMYIDDTVNWDGGHDTWIAYNISWKRWQQIYIIPNVADAGTPIETIVYWFSGHGSPDWVVTPYYISQTYIDEDINTDGWYDAWIAYDVAGKRRQKMYIAPNV